MSSDYIKVKVSPGAAKAGKIIILSFTVVGVLVLLISTGFFISGDTEIANITVIVGFGLIVLGILIYGFIALISSIKTTMSSREINETTKRILILVPSSLLLLIILVILLNL